MPRSAVHPLPQPSGRPVCQYCFAPVEPGAAYCGEDCEDGYWMIVPTIDGSIVEPEPLTPAVGRKEHEWHVRPSERTSRATVCGPRSSR